MRYHIFLPVAILSHLIILLLFKFIMASPQQTQFVPEIFFIGSLLKKQDASDTAIRGNPTSSYPINELIGVDRLKHNEKIPPGSKPIYANLNSTKSTPKITFPIEQQNKREDIQPVFQDFELEELPFNRLKIGQ